MTVLLRSGVALTPARAYYGRWIVDCQCRNAIWLGDYPNFVVCRLCQAAIEIVWPEERMRRGVERLLMMRPNEANRNWSPNETLEDLLWENAAHQVMADVGEVSATPGSALMVEPDRIRFDHLPALFGRYPLKMLD